ncbi:MAG: hypothetical protein A2Z83_09025 [Omnitrophica bacterium GWA2_52_8]|nr:MAG: hypothetical protein A2Z83_09025 [Omnitrophica bacterium GWA2_52_8]
MKIPCRQILKETEVAAAETLMMHTDVILDSLFGTGLKKPVSGAELAAIHIVNKCGKNVIAVDVPSGLDADSGQILGDAVRAKLTATLGIPKKGLFEGSGPALAGRVAVIDIGLPRELIRRYPGALDTRTPFC